MSESSSPSLVGRSIGGYEVLQLLGIGGMGQVFRARQASLRREVALKVLLDPSGGSRERARRFRREMEIHIQLSHPHLIRLLDAGDHEGMAYLAMELAAGGTLEKRLESAGVGELAPVVQALREIGQALAHLHAASIVHRDLKPANVLIDDTGTFKLSDFGLARGDLHSVMTRASQVLGTPRYLAPEVLRGGGAGVASDVYALGVIGYRLASGGYPHEAENLFGYIQVAATQPPVALSQRRPGIPHDLEHLLMKMLATDPAGRPTAAEVAEAVQEMGAPGRRPVTIPPVPTATTATGPLEPTVLVRPPVAEARPGESVGTASGGTPVAGQTSKGASTRRSIAVTAVLLMLVIGVTFTSRARNAAVPPATPSVDPTQRAVDGLERLERRFDELLPGMRARCDSLRWKRTIPLFAEHFHELGPAIRKQQQELGSLLADLPPDAGANASLSERELGLLARVRSWQYTTQLWMVSGDAYTRYYRTPPPAGRPSSMSPMLIKMPGEREASLLMRRAFLLQLDRLRRIAAPSTRAHPELLDVLEDIRHMAHPWAMTTWEYSGERHSAPVVEEFQEGLAAMEGGAGKALADLAWIAWSDGSRPVTRSELQGLREARTAACNELLGVRPSEKETVAALEIRWREEDARLDASTDVHQVEGWPTTTRRWSRPPLRKRKMR